jgi:hypothetical protein
MPVYKITKNAGMVERKIFDTQYFGSVVVKYVDFNEIDPDNTFFIEGEREEIIDFFNYAYKDKGKMEELEIVNLKDIKKILEQRETIKQLFKQMDDQIAAIQKK